MKKKLFMHVCSAQGAENAYDRLKDNYSLGMYFYNPNIQPREMYLEYADKIHKLAERKHIQEFKAPYDPMRLNQTIASWEKDELLQSPCAACLYDRLQQTARTARINGYNMISTSVQSLGNLSEASMQRLLKIVAKEHGLKSVKVDIQRDNHSAISPCSHCQNLHQLE